MENLNKWVKEYEEKKNYNAGTTELVRHDKWGTVYEPRPALIIRKKAKNTQ